MTLPFQLRVLVVDDDAAARARVASILTAAGHQVDLTADGGEALERLDHYLPDVVVLDLVMPVIDGMAFLVQRRNIADAAGIPVIVTSGMADAARLLVGTLGVRAALIKPVDGPQLVAAVQSVLHDASGSPS